MLMNKIILVISRNIKCVLCVGLNALFETRKVVKLF